jgi:phage gpG-like protein
MSVTVSLVIEGMKKLQGKLDRAADNTRDEMHREMKEATLLVAATAKRDYLSGPRPGKLGVMTNRLRSSLATEVRGLGANIQGVVGTNVKSARIHELGGTILPKKGTHLKFFSQRAGHFVSVKKVEMPARPYLSTALGDERKEIEAISGRRVFALLEK